MKLKIPLIIIIVIAIIILIFTFSQGLYQSDFIDNGTSNDNNDNWVNKNLNVTRNNEFTTLSGNSNSSLWYMADYTAYGDFIVEWDNHGNNSNFGDYCLISDVDKTKDAPLNFVNLNLTKDSHVKLVIKDNNITPYVNDVMKTPVNLQTDPNKGMVFRFQINPNGSDISYSNFKIHKIN